MPGTLPHHQQERRREHGRGSGSRLRPVRERSLGRATRSRGGPSGLGIIHPGPSLEAHSPTAQRSERSSQVEPSGPVRSHLEDSMPRAMQTSRRRRGASSRRSRTSRAQLTMSVSLVEHHLREGGHGPRLSETAPIFLAAILEFLVRSQLEQARDEAQRRGAQRLITPQLLEAAAYSNALLGQLLQSITISQVAPPEAQRSRRSRSGR